MSISNASPSSQAKTSKGFKNLKADNSFAKDSGQDTKDDCEICFVPMGGHVEGGNNNKLTSDLLLDFLGRVQPVLQRKCFFFSI